VFPSPRHNTHRVMWVDGGPPDAYIHFQILELQLHENPVFNEAVKRKIIEETVGVKHSLSIDTDKYGNQKLCITTAVSEHSGYFINDGFLERVLPMILIRPRMKDDNAELNSWGEEPGNIITTTHPVFSKWNVNLDGENSKGENLYRISSSVFQNEVSNFVSAAIGQRAMVSQYIRLLYNFDKNCIVQGFFSYRFERQSILRQNEIDCTVENHVITLLN